MAIRPKKNLERLINNLMKELDKNANFIHILNTLLYSDIDIPDISKRNYSENCYQLRYQ